VRFREARKKLLLDVMIELIEIDIRKYGGNHAALWATTVGGVIVPFLAHIRLEASA
jgi:hypothetical protein